MYLCISYKCLFICRWQYMCYSRACRVITSKANIYFTVFIIVLIFFFVGKYFEFIFYRVNLSIYLHTFLYILLSFDKLLSLQLHYLYNILYRYSIFLFLSIYSSYFKASDEYVHCLL